MYYYVDANGLQQGPVSLDQLMQCGIKPQTLVWKAGMAQWEPAEKVPEVNNYLATQAPIGGQTVAQPASAAAAEQCPPDNIAWGVIGLLFCWPFGIPAIISAARVRGLWAQGHHDKARECSANAKSKGLTSLILGIVFLVLYTFILIAASL